MKLCSLHVASYVVMLDTVKLISKKSVSKEDALSIMHLVSCYAFGIMHLEILGFFLS